MLHEEFENLTGITVSHRYYTERIEPEYTEASIDKQTFCTQWIKAHKTDICKALGSDIDGLIRDAALTDVLKNEPKELRRVIAEQRQTIESTEDEVHNLKFEIASKIEIIETLEAENNSLRDDVKDLQHTIDNINSVVGDFEAMEKELAEKDMEIMKLKAMLFDQMYKTA